MQFVWEDRLKQLKVIQFLYIILYMSVHFM